MPRLTKEEARELLWQRGDLSFKIRDYQRPLYDAVSKQTRDEIVLNCARRFGKSFILCLHALETAIKCKNKFPRIKLATSTAKNLEEFILPAFRIILEDCPEDIWPGWSEGYMRSKKKFVGLPNGAEIQLIGIDRDPDAGRGAYCDAYIIDEAGYVDNLAYIFSSVASPMKRNRPGAKIILSSTPPSEPNHPFQDFCDRAQGKDNYVKLTILDNESIDADELAYIRDVECLSYSDFLREYMCEFVVDENLAIIPEMTEDLIQEYERPEYYSYLDKYESMDLGVKIDLTALLFAYYDYPNKRLVIEGEAEINGPDMTTNKLISLVNETEKLLWGQNPKIYKRISDNDNQLLLQDLHHLHNLYFMPTGKDSLHAMVNQVRVLIKNKRIVIHPRCEKLIGCLKYGIWNKKRKQFGRSHTYGHYDHLAALIYLVRNIDEFRDPFPPGYDVPLNIKENGFVRNKQKHNKNHEVIKKIFSFNRKK